MDTVSFNVTRAESKIIQKIAARAVQNAADAGIDYKFIDAEMDVTACHANGCELDLMKLKEFDDFNFNHDVFGIRAKLNRENGKLFDHFRPRCALQAQPRQAGCGRDARTWWPE